MYYPLWLYQIVVVHAHDKPPFPKFSIILSSFLPGKLQLICDRYINLIPPISYNKGRQYKKYKNTKMDISAVIKLLLVFPYLLRVEYWPRSIATMMS